MKLFFSATSPYVRKVMIIAHETGQADSIELLPAAAHPINRDDSIAAVNPTGKVPTALDDDGQPLYDSRVICQYLDSRHDGNHVYPSDNDKRWRVLTLEALGDGVLDAAVAARYEGAVRPEALRWDEWMNGLLQKIDTSLNTMEQQVGELDGLHAGSIAIACALGYLDFRFAERDWRAKRPALARWYDSFAARASMEETAPS